MRNALLLVATFVAMSGFAVGRVGAQEAPTPGGVVEQIVAEDQTTTSSDEGDQDFRIQMANLESSNLLSQIILIFGALVLAIECVLLWRSKSPPGDVMKVFTLSTIVIGTLFIVTAGFEAARVAPAMGLFGTIAGYMLGKEKEKE